VSGLVRAESLVRARWRARRRRTARPLLAAAIVTTVVGGAIWLGYASPLLRLDTVSVKGTSRLSAGDVLAAARVRTGRSLLAVPAEEIRRRVARLAPVASVRVTRAWPHGLVIDVTERTPVATVASGAGPDGAVVLLDAQGVAFAAAPLSSTTRSAGSGGGLVDLRVAAPALGATTPAAVAALRVWAGLPPAVRDEVRWMSADAADDVSFSLARGATVVWGSADDGADKLAVLVSLLRRPAATYDVSTPSIAVTR
jgi:cell division protein FtsQ